MSTIFFKESQLLPGRSLLTCVSNDFDVFNAGVVLDTNYGTTTKIVLIFLYDLNSVMVIGVAQVDS